MCVRVRWFKSWLQTSKICFWCSAPLQIRAQPLRAGSPATCWATPQLAPPMPQREPSSESSNTDTNLIIFLTVVFKFHFDLLCVSFQHLLFLMLENHLHGTHPFVSVRSRRGEKRRERKRPSLKTVTGNPERVYPTRCL